MNFSRQNILIIEDDIETLEIMVELFESSFSNVYTSTNGYDAIEIFKKNVIDVLLCDINIPKLNGLDTINKIREIDYSVPIIIISACSDTETLLKASNCNIQGYILKPIVLDDVKEIKNKIFYHQNYEFMNKNIEINFSTSLDLQNSQIILEEEIIKLTIKETEFLKLLIKKKGAIVSYEIIDQVVWGDTSVMSSTSLRTLVKNIRKKFSSDIIENIPKMGYRIII
uniref:response regulator transcription factor n=1 Tax=Aliarcobacter sp. TaxID=2321116 RepID=UPI004048415D